MILLKLLYVGINRVSQKWMMLIANWGQTQYRVLSGLLIRNFEQSQDCFNYAKTSLLSFSGCLCHLPNAFSPKIHTLL